ncbi:MAG: hypothetical protein LBL13_13525 [Bacteroidales bacterium]|jgi:hypothetical protein|nr:hypothetical protein [Bacteroidales bacterium]
MELGTFITEVLKQISTGVKNAREECDQIEIPELLTSHRAAGGGIVGRVVDGRLQMYEHVEFVNFEVVLSEQVNSENKTGIGVLLSVIGAKAENNNQSNNQSQTRVNFEIPIIWKIRDC